MTSLLECCVDHKNRLEGLAGLMDCTISRLQAVLCQDPNLDPFDDDKPPVIN